MRRIGLVGGLLLIVGILGVSALGVAIYYSSVSFHQNPQVPQGTFTVYREDGTTEIFEGSDQTAIWTWHASTLSFNTTIKVQNIEAYSIQVTVASPDLNLAWTPSGFTQYTIGGNELLVINLSITNAAAIGGDRVGDFTINIHT